MTLSSPTVQTETFVVSELVAYVFGEVARGEYLRMATGAAPEPAQGPANDPRFDPPTAGPTKGQTGTVTVASAGSPLNGNDKPADPNVWRRVGGWPYEANRAGQVRSYHDRKARRIAPTPQRILKAIDDPALGPCVRLWDGKGGSETVAVADLVRRVFGEAAAP